MDEESCSSIRFFHSSLFTWRLFLDGQVQGVLGVWLSPGSGGAEL